MKNNKMMLFCLLLSLSIYSCRDCASSYYNDVKPTLITGTVYSKYEDKSNHNTPTFVILYGNKQMRYPLTGLRNMFISVNQGDSIYKGVGTLRFLVIKSDTVLEFWPKCNQKELSD